jgi:hypothetical protein
MVLSLSVPLHAESTYKSYINRCGGIFIVICFKRIKICRVWIRRFLELFIDGLSLFKR